jgi:CheY-like chemotaxis protein
MSNDARVPVIVDACRTPHLPRRSQSDRRGSTSAGPAAGGAGFDVILSDLMMPDISGMELHDRLAQRWPEVALRMVFITGGARTPAGKAFLERVPNERMDKPFDSAAVRTLVGKFVA